MFQSIRRFISSKFGAAIALGILILIAIAFASGDVADVGTFGGVAGGDRVATVGGERISTSTLRDAATSTLERVRQEEPRMSMKALLAEGGLERILDELADRVAVAVFGRQNGILISDRLVDSEITQMPAFQGAAGNFSQEIFQQALRQRGISEQALRDDIELSLIARQVLIPAGFGSVMPRDLTMRYAGLLTETREAEIAVLPSTLFAPAKNPTDEQLAAYYAQHKGDFIRPERRVLRFATFDAGIVGDAAKPTEEEIAARYKAETARFQASETRQLSQLVVPTEAAARAIVEETAKGRSLEDVARTKGLSVAKLAAADRAELTRQFSRAVSDAAFAAASGRIAAPARSPLGWHVMRVDGVASRPARTLDQVRDELSREILQEKQSAALAERLEEIEAEFAGGASLAEIAKELGVEVGQTQPLTADGRIYGRPGETAPELLKPVLETAFMMEVEDPQLAVVERGARYIMFDVTEIAPSAPAPLDEIKDDVRAAYMLDRGSAEARKAAERVQAEVRKGTSLQRAMAAVGKQLPPAETVRMSRPQLMQIQQEGQGVPAPIALMFQMAEGTVKVQAAPGKQAWFIISLKKVEPGEVKEDEPALAEARRDLGGVAGDEYAQALQRAIRNEVGVEKNSAAIRAVREQLGGN